MAAPEELEFARIARWTTGRQEDEQLVALLAVSVDGQPLALAFSPEAAIELGAELMEQGRKTRCARGD